MPDRAPVSCLVDCLAARRSIAFFAAFALTCGWSGLGSCQASPTLRIEGQTPGATPFISLVRVSVSDPAQLDSLTFRVKSKPGSVVRPVNARYSADYLRRRGYLDVQTGEVTVPVFGLYANYDNTVKLRALFTDGSLQKDVLTVTTLPYREEAHANPEIRLPRTPDTSLSYSFYLLKSLVDANSPLVFDTDGELRWAGTAGAKSMSAIYHRKGVYVAFNTSILRMELDGTVTVLGDYAGENVADFHHNFDRGRDGILTEVDTPTQYESVVMEVDAVTGAKLREWNLQTIIADAMRAGGDDPAAFVKTQGYYDWFHNNSATYRASDNTLLVSSRENFVVALDYDTREIRWILGNPTKTWAQYPSLLRYALALGPDTRPPIGQHALSVVGDELLLFDNGQHSDTQEYPGKARAFSAGRKYRIDTDARTATETWVYKSDEAIFSPYCSSVYEDAPDNYLVDYTTGGNLTFTALVGLNAAGEKVFDYRYPAPYTCAVGFNAVPIHLENLDFNR